MNEEVIKKTYKRPNPEKDRERRIANKERLNEQSRNWNKNNKERLKEYRESNKEILNARSREWQKNNRERAYNNSLRYREKNRDKINKFYTDRRNNNRDEYLQYRKAWRATRNEDPTYRIGERIRSLVSTSFKRGKATYSKKYHTEEILGCSIGEFILYILSKCPEGVTANDFGRFGYHIDHIIPLSIAKTEEEIIKLCHYTNLQPLWWRDNIIKKDKILDEKIYTKFLEERFL